jgi:signal transduction histidine kinase
LYELKSTSAHEALARVVVGFRFFSLAWMTALVVATLVSDTGVRTGWVLTAEGAAVVITVGAVWLKSVGRLDRPWWVMIDGALTLFIVVAPGLAHSGDFFFGSMGLSWLLLVVWAYPSYLHWAVAIVALIAAQLADSAIGIRRLTATRAVGDVAVWIVSGVVYGWAFWIIRDTDLRRQRAEERLAEEKRTRAAWEARIAIADDIHSSVLQAFGHVRRYCRDTEVVEAAAAQELKLRRYIKRISADRLDGFEVALREAAWEVEDRYGVRVEVVCVGDTDRDSAVDSLVAAAREAMANAARWSGQSRISAYGEVTGGGVTLFVSVKDDGIGFVQAAAGASEHRGSGFGIERSIMRRMELAGGSARIASELGKGTEVELVLQRVGHD